MIIIYTTARNNELTDKSLSDLKIRADTRKVWLKLPESSCFPGSYKVQDSAGHFSIS
ncbi:hypothetical protein [Pedobacter gandavensis]|uniref:hypothetical protein n=1 Tax=Pedobacter gandavensis TaxID=2679963 RepID=UPI00292E8D21|nr:hypothetical protein [Pedobacter gandavensis]